MAIFDTYKPLTFPSLPNTSGNTFNKPAPITPFPAPTGPISSTPSVGGTNQPTTNTPRNTSVSPANPLDNTKQINDMYSQVQSLMTQLPQPGYNPPAVNLKIPDKVPSPALNAIPNTTGMNETRKSKQQNVLTSKYAAEEETLLQDIMKLRTGIAGLGATQAREYATAETNPEGQLRNIQNSNLSRLSKDQALELNARTGQLNAYLDNFEMLQGYKPSVVGSPQLDDATGEAFVYLQDPTTGEITSQSLGVVATPNPSANYQKIGDALIDPTTGEVIYQAPGEGYTLGKDQIRYDAQGNPVAYGGSSGGTGTYSGTPMTNFDFSNPDTVRTLPVSTLTKSIMAGTGTMKDLTPTMKADVLQEMYAVGYNPNQVITNKLAELASLWEKMPEDQKGYVQGRKFWASSLVPEVAEFNSARQLLTREIARLKDVGVLSDYDVKSYEDAMPARTDKDLEVVKSKIAGLGAASGVKQQADKYPVGTQVTLDNGKTAKKTASGWVDAFTGAKIEVE